MRHSFDTELAAVVGIEAAILVANIEFWIEKNRANDKHLHNGLYWTYNSIKAWQELFPYMTKDVIRRRLDKLVELGILLRDSFNEDPRDRTAWYTLSDANLDVSHLAAVPPSIGSSANSSMNTDIKHTDTPASNESGSQKALFDSTPEQEKPKANKEKEKNIPTQEYGKFIEIWMEVYKTVGLRMPRDGVKIKSLIAETKRALAARNVEPSETNTVEFWDIFVRNLHKTWGHGKDLATIDSKYTSLIFEMENGKSTGKTKQQSTREWLNSL